MSDSILASSNIRIRPAVSTDVTALFNLVLALAEYEQLSHAVTGSIAALQQHLFTDACIDAIVAEQGDQAIGFALFFTNYSTFITQPGFYLEDLFVLPQFRGQGVGRAMLTYLAKRAVERGFGRIEWSVLDWNQPAIDFYQRIGATILDDVRICRVAEDALLRLARLSSLANLRPAVPADVIDAFALVRANIEHDGSLHLFRGSIEALAEHLFERHYLEAVVAEQDGRRVGLAMFFATYSTFLTKPGLFIEDLFVESAYRGRGIGKALLAYLAQQVMQRDYGRLEWRVRTWNQQAIEFYQGIGASILPDWRVCQLYRADVARLALK